VILKKSLSFKVGIILFIIWLFVFGGYLERFRPEWIYCCENSRTYCHICQRIVYASRNTVRVWIESGYKQKSTIEIGARLGPRKWYSKSRDIPLILLVFIGVWEIAIIFVLGAILYRIVIGPLIKKRKLRWNKRRQNQLDQNR
jgi:hypothetical protein